MRAKAILLAISMFILGSSAVACDTVDVVDLDDVELSRTGVEQVRISKSDRSETSEESSSSVITELVIDSQYLDLDDESDWDQTFTSTEPTPVGTLCCDRCVCTPNGCECTGCIRCYEDPK